MLVTVPAEPDISPVTSPTKSPWNDVEAVIVVPPIDVNEPAAGVLPPTTPSRLPVTLPVTAPVNVLATNAPACKVFEPVDHLSSDSFHRN